MNKNTQEICVLVNGNTVKEYVHNGHTYIEAKNGSNFSIRLKNNGGSRVMAIISVDGIDVITGEKASDTQSGYVLSPYSSTEIKGFRIDADQVASFKFTEKGKGNGYAEIKGDATNAGVIGVRIYSEKINISDKIRELNDSVWGSPNKYPLPYKTPILYDKSSAGDFYNSKSHESYDSFGTGEIMCSNMSLDTDSLKSSVKLTSSNIRGFDTITEFGSKIESKIVTTKFDMGLMLSEFTFLYASKASLKQMGIQFNKPTEVRIPDAFDKNMKFCTPPAGWSG